MEVRLSIRAHIYVLWFMPYNLEIILVSLQVLDTFRDVIDVEFTDVRSVFLTILYFFQFENVNGNK